MTTKSIGTADAANVVDHGSEPSGRTVSRRLLLGGAAAGGLGLALGPGASSASAAPAAPKAPGAAAPLTRRYPAKTPLWKIASDARLTYGTSHSSRLFDQTDYCDLVDQQAAILFTEDDLLWYELKPTPDSKLDFSYGDKLYARAEKANQLVFAAHLVWDEGFGDGWGGEDFSTLYDLSHDEASELLYGVEKALVTRYRGRTAGWIVANEVTSPEGKDGLRTDVPWYQTLGSGYVAKAFRLAKKYDRHAVRVLNEYGFESTNSYDDDPEARQQAFLKVLKKLRRDDVPVDAVGIQAHLVAQYFLSGFDPKSYRRFLRQVADLGVDILITEMDVLDDGLPADPVARDAAVAECYARYLETVLPDHDVKALMTFGLSDRNTWLQEDYPRDDGAARRPLPYDEDLHPKLAYDALRHALADAPRRDALWHLPKHR